MSAIVPAAAAEFLDNYTRDARLRWAPNDLAEQQEFVTGQLTEDDWLDWSTPGAALQLVQTGAAQTPMPMKEKYEAVVLAGPVVELIEPPALFGRAGEPLGPGGKLVGIIPCLRDNSPESDRFMHLARATLWSYYTAEELLEMLGEAGWCIEPPVSGFRRIRRFNQAVLNDQLGFKGFNRVFTRLSAEGYDPLEVGWGELRFAARCNAPRI